MQKSKEIDLEGFYNVPIEVERSESFASYNNNIAAQPREQPLVDPETEAAINEMELCMKQAQLDMEDVTNVIHQLKEGRAELKKSKVKEDHVTRRQMKAKKEALKLHKRYLKYSIGLHQKFSDQYRNAAVEDRRDLLSLIRVITQVLNTSHNKIQEVIEMPLENSIDYCKNVKIRMGGAMRFAQNNPKTTGAGTVFGGLILGAGLTFVLGPFGALIAIAVTVSSYTYICDKSTHEYTKTFDELKTITNKMNAKRIQQARGRSKMQRKITTTLSRNTTTVPTSSRNVPIQSKVSGPFGGSAEVD